RGSGDDPAVSGRPGIEVDHREEVGGLPGLVPRADVEVPRVAGFPPLVPGLAERLVRPPDGGDPAEEGQTDGHRSQPKDRWIHGNLRGMTSRRWYRPRSLEVLRYR